MPKMRPIEQWICDTCGQLIDGHCAGALIFKTSSGASDVPQKYDFRIVHRAGNGPHLDKPYACYPVGANGFFNGEDLDLTHIDHSYAYFYLLNFLDPGEGCSPEFQDQEVKSIREWSTLVRRLTLPYYEEARQYFDLPRANEWGWNEWNWNDPDRLKELIEDAEERPSP